MKYSRQSLSIAALIFLFALSAHAQNEPIIFEAESAASISSLYSTGTQNGTAFVTIVNDSPGFGPPATQEGALTYTVTFPVAGNYELYVRLLVGPGGGSDDSFFLGTGFGDKIPTAGPWTLVNNFAGGYTDPNETVRNAGSAGNQVFKWFKVTGFAGPNPWVVPAGNLTQTFQFAGRETGLLVDKFAFGYQGFFYTVGNLDTGSPPTGTPPPPPPPPYDHPGPPMATGKDKFVGSAWSPGEASLQFASVLQQGDAGECRQVGLCRGDARCDELDRRRYGLQPGQVERLAFPLACARLGQPATALDRKPAARRATGGDQ